MKYILSLIVSVVFLGCVEKARTIHEHEARQEVNVQTPQLENESVESANFDSSNLVLSQVLDPDKVSRAGYGFPEAERQRLMATNQQTLNLITMNDNEQIAAAREIYRKAVNVNCGKIISNCLGITFFRQAFNSAEVFRRLGESEDDISLAYEWWFKALLVNNRQMNPELSSDILVNASAYLKTPMSPARRDQFRSLLSTLILSMDRFPNIKWPKEMNPWPLVLDDQNFLEPAAQVALSRQVLVQHRPSLTEEAVAGHADSLFNIQKELASDKSLNWSSLGLKALPFGEPFYTYLDLVSIQKLSPEAGVALMNGIRITPKELKSEVNQFLRTHFLAAVKKANKIYKERVFDLRVSGDELYFAAIRESTSVRAAWSELKTRMVLIREYSMKVATSLNFSDQDLGEIRAQFEGIDQSIRMTVLYPHLMALFHKLSEQQFTIRTRRGDTIDSGDLMVLLYNGQFEPILPYVDENISLSPIEMLYAFDLGLRTGIFKDLGIDIDEMMATTVSRFSEYSVKDLQNGIDDLEKKLRNNQKYSGFVRICEEVRTGKMLPRTVFWREVDTSPYLGYIRTNLFEGFGVKASSEGRQIYNYNYFDTNYSELAERVRVDLSAVARLAESMIRSYKSAQKSSTPTAPVKTEAELKRIIAVKDQFVRQSKTLWAELGGCYLQIARKDREIMSQAFRYEKEYLKQVAKDVEKLRDPGQQDVSKILERYNNKILDANYQSRDEISDRGYQFGRVDVLLRFIRYMKYGLKTDEVDWPALAPHINYSFGGTDLSPLSDQLRDINEVAFIPYTNPDEFVESGIRLISVGTFRLNAMTPAAWVRPFVYDEWWTWDRRMMALVSLYRALHGTSDQFVTADMVIDDHESYLNLSHYNDMDIYILNAMKSTRQVNPVVFKWSMILFRMLGDKILDRFGLFDLPLKYASEGELGRFYYNQRTALDPDSPADQRGVGTAYEFPIKRQGSFALALDYFKIRSQTTRKNIWIGLNPVLDQYLDDNVLSFYKKEVESYDDLRAVVMEKAKQDEQLPDTQRQHFNISLADVIRGPFLKPSIDLERREKIKDFSYKTGFCFAKDLDCPEFKAIGF